MNKAEKARRGFNYGCKQASKCRHEKYMVSCYACPEYKTCEIQERIERHHKVMKEEESRVYYYSQRRVL